MRKLLLLLLVLPVALITLGQNPATTFTIANRNIILPCGSPCTSITAQVPHIKQTTGYVITNPAYVPFAYTTPGGTVVSQIYIDDTWSPVINLPFNFCYYGTNYPSLLMGSNSAITFDISRAGTGSGYSISATNGAIPNTAYAPSMIFGPYHDIHPGLASTNKKIEWRVEGTAPKRRFIGSYNDVPYFGSSCTVPRATHMMVLYEGTGIVEVYIKDKPFCTAWNSGLTILGMQDQTRTNAIAATGKNATVWGSNAMDSCWRFIPSGGASRLKSAELLVAGTSTVIANADTSTLSAGVLNLNFPNVCPAADSTAYVLRVTYNDCIGNPPTDVVFTDTVYVKKLSPSLTVAKVDPTCLPNGTITISATGGSPAYQYSINGGTTFQPSNVFTGLSGGTYNVVVRDAQNCTATQTITLNLVNTMTSTAAKTDANCTTGGSITITAAGGGNPPYEYSINGGSTWQSSNTFTGLAAGTYTVIARNVASGCTSSQTVTITFTNTLTINTVNGGSVCLGNSFTPTVVSNATTYSWSPTTGVSNPNIANPVITPTTIGNITYTVTATLGTCTQQRSFNLNVFPGASASAGPDVSIIAGDTYQIPATGSVGSYLWTPSTGLNSANILNPNATPATTTTYTLTVTNPQGCIATDDVQITVIPYCIKPMEAFTPNGDGINDLWLITNGNCLVSAKAQVFNRYGSKVFESNDYKNNWNGTYEGKPLPDGTYYYVISYQLIGGRMQYLKGNLTILR
ncbi:MAG: gliding motility-associated C-terminal domain-containing protein [Chitinophagaceae bacterium]|nr:gliding motility-associated C-terminal domain-containing protein [Chitinophagaceae bacterium]